MKFKINGTIHNVKSDSYRIVVCNARTGHMLKKIDITRPNDPRKTLPLKTYSGFFFMSEPELVNVQLFDMRTGLMVNKLCVQPLGVEYDDTASLQVDFQL